MTNEEFSRQFALFQQQSAADGRFAVVEASHPILDDDKPAHDEKDVSHDYLWHTAWAARKLAAKKPSVHYDFGSYVYFAGLCSAFIEEFVFCDIRPVSFPLPGLRQNPTDLTNLAEFCTDGHYSLSCLHVLEHIGLGRYGDTLDAQGDLKAARELTRILAPGGQLLMVLPMDEHPCVRFNGERYYSWEQVRQMFAGLKMTDMATIWGGALRTDIPANLNYTGLMAFTKEKAVSA